MAKRPTRTVGRPASRGLELELRRVLGAMVAQIRQAMPRIRTLGDVRALGAALRKRWPDARIRALVTKIGIKAEARASLGWSRWDPKNRRSGKDSFRTDAVEYDGEALVEKWSKTAASKITSVRDEVAEAMRKDVVRALGTGQDPAELAAHWRAQGIPVEFGTLEGRVKVIAQHQLATLHSNVQAERARASGVTEFFWRTQQDDKVRPAHRALEGRRCQYDDPPTLPSGPALPGEEVNCRCYAESIIPDDLLAEFEGALSR